MLWVFGAVYAYALLSLGVAVYLDIPITIEDDKMM